MRATALMICALSLNSVMALADETPVEKKAEKVVDLDKVDITIQNELTEAVTLRRTRYSPLSVKLRMNPEVESSSYCEDYDTRESCSSSYCDDGDDHYHGGSGGGWSGSSGGSSGDGDGGGGCTRVQGPDGRWTDSCGILMIPRSHRSTGRSCCTTHSTCVKWGTVNHYEYKKFELNFKDNLLEEGQIDLIQLIPSADRKITIRILEAKLPYRVKQGGLFRRNKFDLRQKE